MSGGNFVQTRVMFEVMSDLCFYFPRLHKLNNESEYTVSKKQFLEDYEDKALSDVQDIWNHADKKIQRQLLDNCLEKLVQQIHELEDIYRQIYKEIYTDKCRILNQTAEEIKNGGT